MENSKAPTKRKVKLYRAIPETLRRVHNLSRYAALNPWLARQAIFDACELALEQWVKDYLPYGSGFDAGTSLATTPAPYLPRLVFDTAYHHMDDNGGYQGWTHHKVVIRPDWDGFRMVVSGPDTNQIKSYIEDCFYQALTQEVELP